MGWNADGKWVVLEFKRRIWYVPNDDICNGNDGGVSVAYLHQSPVGQKLRYLVSISVIILEIDLPQHHVFSEI